MDVASRVGLEYRHRILPTSYRNRRAAVIENDALRVTILEEGGHIAEIRDRATGVNPLWTPDWPSIEPSQYDASRHALYGGGADATVVGGPQIAASGRQIDGLQDFTFGGHALVDLDD